MSSSNCNVSRDKVSFERTRTLRSAQEIALTCRCERLARCENWRLSAQCRSRKVPSARCQTDGWQSQSCKCACRTPPLGRLVPRLYLCLQAKNKKRHSISSNIARTLCVSSYLDELLTEKVGCIVDNPTGEMLNTEGTTVHKSRFEQSRILFMLNLDHRYVRLGTTSLWTLDVQHAQQTRSLEDEKITRELIIRIIDRMKKKSKKGYTSEEIRSMQGTLST